jgi:hypothetical protein
VIIGFGFVVVADAEKEIRLNGLERRKCDLYISSIVTRWKLHRALVSR